MKFTKLAVVSNFPYQMNNDKGDEKTSHASPIYQKFIECVIDTLNPDYFTTICPSRWMTFGRGLDSFRERMMNDTRLKKIVHFGGSSEVFTNVEIKGGVSYFNWVKDYNGECEFVNGNVTTKRFLNIHDIILQDNNAFGILEKITSKCSSWMNKPWAIQTPFGIVSSFNQWSNSTNDTVCYSSGKTKRNVSTGHFTDKHNIIGKWKVCTSKAINPNKEGNFDKYNNIFIIEPNTICTQTYIVVNVFDSKTEAENFISYMNTKFFRFMLGLRVLTQDISKEKFAWTPDQLDYSAKWTDKELYMKYSLTRQEIAYIESKIKAI